MIRWLLRLPLLALLLSVFTVNTPAPLIYTPGEGWSYEPIGGGKWRRTRAKDQLDVAQEAFDKKDYSTSLKASQHLVRTWPFSDYAPKAQFLAARSYEEKGQDEKAFKAYQTLIENYPKLENYEEVLQRQFAIATTYLGGKWFKLWGYIPFFPSMDKTSDMYAKVIKNGPYSQIAPEAQMSIGKAREKQDNFDEAVKAYETAADRYHDRKQVAADALYKAGLAYHKQAKEAEYDQSIAGEAIATFTDFMTLYPEDPRVPEARGIISELKTEQARGSFIVAQFYEKKKKFDGALVYYNEVLVKDPESKYAEQARRRIEEIKARIAPKTAQTTAQN